MFGMQVFQCKCYFWVLVGVIIVYNNNLMTFSVPNELAGLHPTHTIRFLPTVNNSIDGVRGTSLN